MATDNFDLGGFIGKVIGKALASGVDSVLEDGEKTLKGATTRIQKARTKIRHIKEHDDGQASTEERGTEEREQKGVQETSIKG